MTVDVEVSGGGTVYLFTPLTQVAKDWVEEHVQVAGYQQFGPGFAVDHRYAGPLADGMEAAGLVVR